MVGGAVAIVGLVVIAYAVVAPHGAGPATRVGALGEIDLLPSGGTVSHCITGVPGVPRPTYPLEYGILQANTYNVPTGTTGEVGMCYDAARGTMLGYANWSHVGAGGGWFSYPQIAYGVNFWYGPYTTYTNQSSAWALPQTVAEIANESVWFTTSYALNAPTSADVSGYDLSLDDYLTETVPTYFEVGPFVEVEMFLAHNISYPFEWVHWATPTLVNGVLASVPWDVGWWCHGPTPDNGSNENVSFDLSLDGQATRGVAEGVVGVNLSAIYAEVDALMPSVTCWQGPTHGFSGFHLQEANLGSEDGALGNASYSYNWTIDDYCIHARVSTPTPAAVDCG